MMDISRLTALPGIQTFHTGPAQTEITDGFTSDLLSDVMANAPAQSALITIQAHINTVAVASLGSLSAIILCSGRTPDESMRQAAVKQNIWLLGTSLNQYRMSVALSSLLSAS